MYPASRRAVRLPSRVHGSPHGLSLRLDPFRRHPDRNDRRGRRRVRPVPRRALPGDHARPLRLVSAAATSRRSGGDPVAKLGLTPQRLVALISIWVLTWINLRGVREGKIVQTTLTVVKTGALALLIMLGLTIGRNADAIAANFGDRQLRRVRCARLGAFVIAFGAALVGSLFSSDAWNNVTFAAAEVKNPQRNLPLALLLGTGLVSLLYILANVAYLNVLPLHGVDGRRDRAGARNPVRDAGPRRHRGGRDDLRRRAARRSWRSRFSSRRSAATTG